MPENFRFQSVTDNAVKVSGLRFKPSTDRNHPFPVRSAHDRLANKNLLTFIFLVIDKTILSAPFSRPGKTSVQCRKDVTIDIVNNHIVNLAKKIILKFYYPLNIGRLFRGHTIKCRSCLEMVVISISL